MPNQSTCSPDRFDLIRQQHPDLAINLYAMTPGGIVTLEIFTPDGSRFSWDAETAEAAFAMAFPAPQSAPDTGIPVSGEQPTDIFD